MAHYPSNPTNGQKIGANLCPDPQFPDTSNKGTWSAGTLTGSPAYLGAFNPTTKNPLPNVPVTVGDTYKIWIYYATNGQGPATVGVRPVGSARTIAPNLPDTNSFSTYQWAVVTDEMIDGDTGTQAEVYMWCPTSSVGLRMKYIRVDYADTPVTSVPPPTGAPGTTGFFSGKTTDDATHDYGWDGAVYHSPSSALALGAGDTTPPSVPTGVTVNNLNTTTVEVRWTASTDDVGVAGYNVYEDGLRVATAVTSPWQRTGLTPNTSHAYTVTATDIAGNESAPSAAASGTPPTPLNLRQIPHGPGSGNDYAHVHFQWDAVTHPRPVKYKVYEGLSLQNESTTAPIDQTDWLIGVVPASNVNPTDRLIHPVHRFAVAAIDDAGKESPKSVSINPITDNLPVWLESTQTGGHDYWAIGITYTTCDVGWTPGRDDNAVVGYDVWVQQFDVGEGYKANSTQIPYGSETYRITGLRPNIFYHWWVDVFDDIGQRSSEGGPPYGNFSFFSTPPTSDNPPTQPTNLQASSIGETNVVLGWKRSYDPDNVDYRPMYVVFENGEIARDKDGRSIGEAGYASDVTEIPATSINLTNLAPASTHHYTVLARDEYDVYSEPSDPLTVTLLGGTPPPVDTPPSTPTGLAVNATDDTTATIAWNASTDDVGVAGYNVYLDGAKFNGALVTDITYQIIGLAPGTAYNVRIKAVDTIGQTSTFSAQVTATTTGTAPAPPTPPAAPTGLIVSGATDTTVGLAWDIPVTPVARYDVTRDAGPVIAQLDGTANTFTDTGLVPGTRHTYTVRARDDAGLSSPASAAVSATTTGAPAPVAAPTGLHTVAITDTTVELAWNDNTDPVTGYHVYRGGVALTGSPITATDYTAEGLTSGTDYSFTVKAVGTVGQLSPASAAVSATTTGAPSGPPDQPPPETVTGQDIAAFLQQADNTALVATADPLAETVTLLAQGYTRGVGFTAGQPNAEIAAVITMATARLAAHPEQIPVSIGTVTWRSGGFNGWTLTELYVLNRYRSRSA